MITPVRMIPNFWSIESFNLKGICVNQNLEFSVQNFRSIRKPLDFGSLELEKRCRRSQTSMDQKISWKDGKFTLEFKLNFPIWTCKVFTANKLQPAGYGDPNAVTALWETGHSRLEPNRFKNLESRLLEFPSFPNSHPIIRSLNFKLWNLTSLNFSDFSDGSLNFALQSLQSEILRFSILTFKMNEMKVRVKHKFCLADFG